MTSNTTSNQWPRTAAPAFARPFNPTALPASKQTPRSCPHPNLPEPDAVPAASSSAAQPLLRRQKSHGESCKAPPGAYAGTTTPKSFCARNESRERTSDGNAGKGMLWQTTSTSSQDNNQLPRSRSPLLPLHPSRKQAQSATNRGNSSAAQRAASRGAVQNQPYVIEAPSSAPRFRTDGEWIRDSGLPRTVGRNLDIGCADFHPWTGHHAEDLLNESTTKNGSYDKPQLSQNETSTARHAVWSSLKHKSGIQVLSSLFVSALDQRQAHGAVTSTCTFKPPPRVTLTDTKREIWLRDLADPDIPLRRLSRTIPHGIRGKVLLDQCLAKKIPISRAVWLAKCVGANEIRAFKRKGAGGAFTVGGESKWIKDWTSNVEQFVESIIDTCGSRDWKLRIDYG